MFNSSYVSAIQAHLTKIIQPHTYPPPIHHIIPYPRIDTTLAIKARAAPRKEEEEEEHRRIKP